MTLLRAHFDGKSVILDEPANLRPNQQVLVQVDGPDMEVDGPDLETVGQHARTDFSLWLGMAKTINPAPRFESDADLW